MKLLENGSVATQGGRIAHPCDINNLDVDDVDSEKIEKTYIVTRLHKMLLEEPWDYSGIFYSNSFKVNKPINLIGVGFYGPYSGKNTVYQVEIHIEEMQGSKSNKRVIYATKVGIRAIREQSIMTVDFNNRISLQRNTWYTIKFQLDGPPTFRGENKLKNMIHCADAGVDFDFFRGSQQMPYLKYSSSNGLH